MENPPLYQQMLARRSELKTERATWISQYQEISRLIMPRTGRFLITGQNKGGKVHNNIYDETATRAVRVTSAGLMAGASSPARPWFRVTTRDKKLAEFGPVKAWLAIITDTMRAIFAQSNTYRALHTIYEELVLYGTAASIVMDDFDDVLRHYPATCGEYTIALDARGQVNTLYREFEMTVAQLVARFGKDKVSKGVRNMWDTGRALDAWVPVLHVIEPRADRNLRSPLSRDLPYTSNYMEIGGRAGESGAFLQESGFKRFAALCPRWHAAGGDIYGNSPAMEALGSVKQLQHGQLRKGQAIDYKVRPPLQVPMSMKNMPLSTLPGGTIYVDSTGPGNAIRSAWDVGITIGEQLEDIRDVRQRINQTFYVDMFLMLAQADQGSPITAREVAEKHEEKLLMLGPVLERLDNELLKPKIDITFDRMIETGIVPPPPQEMHEQPLDVEFVGMLAQAQRAIGVASVDRVVNTIGIIAVHQRNAGMTPTAMDKLNVDNVIDGYADMLGLDPDMITANEQVAIIRDQRAQAQAAAMKAQQMQMAAEAANKLGNTPTGEQNALTDIVSQFSGYGGPGVPVAA